MSGARRFAALLALVVAAVAVGSLMLGGDGTYAVKANFQNASQLVKGNLIQVAGTKVGVVKDIKLTDDGQAQVRFEVDGDFAPLKAGTRAIVRQASLSGVANRYIDLQQGPATGDDIEDGGVLQGESTESAVDIDQLFNIFDPKSREATRKVIDGFAEMADGQTKEANEALKYLNPALSASSRFFNELSRNEDDLERFVVETSRFVTDVADKRDDLAGIVRNFGAVSTTLAQRDEQLASAVNQLPGFLRRSNTTFVNLRATLDDLDPLVRESRPVVRALRPLLADLRPFARDASPTFRDLSRTIRRPGSGNDLIELFNAQPAVDRIANGPVEVNGKERRGAFPETAAALEDSAPKLAFFRPYAPDLTGWFDDFSTSGVYDAIGGFSRAGLAFSAFTLTPTANPVLQLVPPDLRDEALAAGADIGRNNRCPGSSERQAPDRTNPYRPTEDFSCDPTQVPVGN